MIFWTSSVDVKHVAPSRTHTFAMLIGNDSAIFAISAKPLILALILYRVYQKR